MTETEAWHRLSTPQITAAVFLCYNAVRAFAKSPFCDCQQDLQLLPQTTGWFQGSVAGFNSLMAKTYDKPLNLGPDELLTFINTMIFQVPMHAPDSLTMGLKKWEFHEHSKNQSINLPLTKRKKTNFGSSLTNATFSSKGKMLSKVFVLLRTYRWQWLKRPF